MTNNLLRIKIFIFKFLPILNALKHFLFWKIFSYSNYKISLALKDLNISPSYIIDVGGNIGQFAYAVNYFLEPKKLFVFEPNIELIKTLRKNYQDLQTFILLMKLFPILLKPRIFILS